MNFKKPLNFHSHPRKCTTLIQPSIILFLNPASSQLIKNFQHAHNTVGNDDCVRISCNELNWGGAKKEENNWEIFFTIILFFLFGDVLCLHFFFERSILCTPVYSRDLFFSEMYSIMTNSFLKMDFFVVRIFF